ncbi:hypothetical protein DLM46_37105 [Paraburkholderia lacunae]|uniref:Lipoprotein n=1 Tax=Paraburkholderia lacunae TaxID=2211104 RepID=A0A370MW29_9BURK|nr:hypothetical protein DLM46_37105 [Paraburkholderia lacunae]
MKRSFLSCSAVALIAAGVATGCASVTDVVASDKPDVYMVTAQASGTSLAWAHAHEKAVSAAASYCKQKGMQPAIKSEATSGVTHLEQHSATVSFECHPQAWALGPGAAH